MALCCACACVLLGSGSRFYEAILQRASGANNMPANSKSRHRTDTSCNQHRQSRQRISPTCVQRRTSNELEQSYNRMRVNLRHSYCNMVAVNSAAGRTRSVTQYKKHMTQYGFVRVGYWRVIENVDAVLAYTFAQQVSSLTLTMSGHCLHP